MKWIPDKTGRFPQRPFFEPEELDYICEGIVSAFLLERHAAIQYPVTSNDLEILLERETSDVDFYADLTDEGVDVEGVTQFIPNQKPKVRITQNLANVERYANRYRTTLTHELGHVKLHSFLWASGQLPLLPAQGHALSPKCKRENILGAREIDWMEWQAGYASGAYLMPITPLKSLVRDVLGKTRLTSIQSHSFEGQGLIHAVQRQFQVSAEAAEVRLRQLRFFFSSHNISLQLS